MPILIVLWKFKYWIAIAVLSFICLGQLAYINHLAGKIKDADAACIERINKVNDAYQSTIDAWRAKVFIVENELEAERNNIKVEFRDIKHETQKVTTNTIYRDCKLDDAGMSIAERARIAANTRKPVSAVQ
ncbi:hypothetical protein [Acinetobacter wanghuae]|uniref:hypothetical protein n=1 Tax=Acinetobacter wanghuae TaxID=2662362 RepID=UPI003AF784E3